MTQSEVDDAARRSIREVLDETFLVEAGAGTGKTSALVERVVALVLGGRKIEAIVAITFTEKAAAELRDRIRTGLEDRLQAGDLDLEPRRLVEAALASLDRAHVSTIHSFCQALLRQFAPELGVDPDFDIQDEVLAERRFEEQWRTYLDAMGGDPAARAVVDRLLTLGLSTWDMANLASALWKQPELAPLLARQPLQALPPLWPNLAALRSELRSLGLERVPAGDKLKAKLERLLAAVEGLLDLTNEREAYLAAVAGSFKEVKQVGSAANWGGTPAVQRARAVGEAIAAMLSETLATVRSHALAPLVAYVVDFVLRDATARGRGGTLVFDDLILGARRLLSTNRTALDAVRARFDCMLIDEFQDTDPLQVEIAWSFGSDPDTGMLEPGRLFLVGDPKQSIYRFRRADMAVYSAVRDRVEGAGGRLPGLRQNRRSRRVVVDWVNSVFETVIGDGSEPDFQPPYHGIDHARDERLAGPGVAWFGDGLEAPAREVRRLEGEAVAAQIRRAVEDGWQVEDRERGVARGAGFRDIAVLVPTRTILTPLERALQDAAVPYRVEGGSLVYGTQEIRDIINCLTAIDDSADEVAVVAALRSPAYACSDVDLARFKLEQQGSFNYLHPALAGWQGRVADGLRSLKTYHEARHEFSLSFLVERFLSESGLVEVGILDQVSRNSFRRARFVVEQARAFEAAGPESLRAFVGWLESRAGKAILDNEGAALDDDEDAIRILTIHGAKGLEFPIVFLAGIGGAPPGDRRIYGLDRTTHEISVSVGSAERGRFNLGPVAQITQQETSHLRRERDRLLYVAATRARDHLVISLYHKAGTADSGALRLIGAGARETISDLQAPPARPRAQVNALVTLAVDDAGPIEDFDLTRESLVAAARRQSYTSATGLANLPDSKKETSDDTEPWARGRGGTHLGRAVHASLQSLAWDAGDEELAAVTKAQAVAEAIPDRADEVAALARRALQSEAAARAGAARRALREVPFAVPFGSVLVEGFADVVVETDAGLEIIDWKTDDVTAADAQERLTRYETQAGLYALGLQSATGRTVTRITYVFVRPGLELSPGDPAALATRALSLIERR